VRIENPIYLQRLLKHNLILALSVVQKKIYPGISFGFSGIYHNPQNDRELNHLFPDTARHYLIADGRL
jgi:hypothetical protein